MKGRQYLRVVVTAHSGTTFENPLKLSEAHFVSQLAQENRSLYVELISCSVETYNIYFN
jgi:hypothetical protein